MFSDDPFSSVINFFFSKFCVLLPCRVCIDGTLAVLTFIFLLLFKLEELSVMCHWDSD